MKKLIFVAVMIFAFMFTMNVTFAACCGGPVQQSCACPDQSNTAIGVNNGITSNAISGGSEISGGLVGNATIISGASVSGAAGVNAINSNVKVGTSWYSQPQTNTAMFSSNGITSGAQSGGSKISGVVVGGGTIVSAGSLSGAKGINLINTNVKVGR
jgi:hypothetical protein